MNGKLESQLRNDLFVYKLMYYNIALFNLFMFVLGAKRFGKLCKIHDNSLFVALHSSFSVIAFPNTFVYSVYLRDRQEIFFQRLRFCGLT